MTPRTVGVEEEFLLVRSDGSLAEAGDDVADAAAERDSDGQFERELKRAQAEIGSKPTEDLADLSDDLHRLRNALAAAAGEYGAFLLASGTHPSREHARTTSEHRYEQMTRTFGQVARQQLTCGMHVHVGVDSAEEGVAVIDRIRPYLALLTALSANSPFYAGQDTGYASYRTVLWGQWPSAGQTETFGSVSSYRELERALIASGAALDPGMLYFDARLSANYPTVEIRVADVCPDVTTAVAIAALARALAETAARGELPLAPDRIELLRARAWRSARWGLSDELLDVAPALLRPSWECIDHMVQTLTPALNSFGDLDRVTETLADVRAQGSGADRQRAAYREGGFRALYEAVRVPGSR